MGREYTPIEDWIGEEVGVDLYTAMAYSVIARYEKMRKGKCTASISTLAQKGLMSVPTFWRRIQVLKEMGFIKDLTPHRMKATHEFITLKRGPSESVSERNRTVSEGNRSVSERDRSVSVGCARNTKGIQDKSTNRNTTLDSQKNENQVRLREEDNMRNYVPGPANYTNGDPVKAYRNMARVRITAESEALIAESVTDVPAWEFVLRKAKLDKLDLANVPVLLTEYASCCAEG